MHAIVSVLLVIISLTLKAPITAAADDSLNIFPLFFRENKT